jgi:hypothetical protein
VNSGVSSEKRVEYSEEHIAGQMADFVEPLTLPKEPSSQLLNHNVEEDAFLLDCLFLSALFREQLIVQQSSDDEISKDDFEVSVVPQHVEVELGDRKFATMLQRMQKFLTVQIKHSAQPHPQRPPF